MFDTSSSFSWSRTSGIVSQSLHRLDYMATFKRSLVPAIYDAMQLRSDIN